MAQNQGLHSSEEQCLPLGDLFLRLQLHDPNFGLSNEQVAVSRQVYGANVWRKQGEGLSVAFLLSDLAVFLVLIAAYYVTSSGEFAALGTAMFLSLFVIRGAYLCSVVRYIGRKGAVSASSYTVLRAGQRQLVQSEDLVPGDVLDLSAGMLVPAPLRLLHSEGCKAMDLADFQTYVKTESADLNRPLRSKEGLVEAGLYVCEGKCTGVVLEVGVAGRGAGLPSENVLQTAVKLSEVMWTVTVLLCLSAVVLMRTGLDTDLLVLLVLVLYEACIPHSFPAQLCLFANSTASLLTANRITVSDNKTLFTLGDVNCICLEAKDVLTEFEYEVTAAIIDHEPRQFESASVEFSNGSSLSYLRLLLAGVLTVGEEKGVSGKQIGLQRVLRATQSSLYGEYPLVDRIPFRENEVNYAIARTPDPSLSLIALSGPFALLSPMCKFVLHSGHSTSNDEETKSGLAEMHRSLEMQGIATHSFAYAEVPTKLLEGSWDMNKLPLVFAGSLGLEPKILDGVSEAIAECRLNSMHVLLLTSIPLAQATSVALKSNILTGVSTVQATCVSFRDLERLPAKAMVKDLLLKPELVLAEVDMAGKASVLAKLKSLGNVPITVGFDVKIEGSSACAYERSASAALATADVVISAGSLRGVLAATHASQHLVDCARKLCFLDFSSWAPEVVPFVLAAGGLPAPLSLPLLAVYKVIKETLGVLAVAKTPPEPVRAKTRLLSPKAQILSMCIMPCIYLFLPLFAYFATMLLCGFDPERLVYLGTGTQPDRYDTYDPSALSKGNTHAGNAAYLKPWPLSEAQDMRLWFYNEATWQPCWTLLCYSSEALNLAQTAYFLSLATQMLVTVFSMRSIISSCIRTSFRPVAVQVAILLQLGLVLAVAYAPLLNSVLGTRPLPWNLFLIAVLPGAAVTLAEVELYKWRLRSRS